MKFKGFLLIVGMFNLSPLTPSLPAQANEYDLKQLECMEGKIRFRDGKIRKSENSKFCFNKNRNRLLSQNCAEQKCQALTAKSTIRPAPNLRFQQGSPGFKDCWRRGGTPHLLEFFDGKKWWELDRCLFASDQSFINSDWLP